MLKEDGHTMPRQTSSQTEDKVIQGPEVNMKDLMDRENVFETERGSLWRYFNDESGTPTFKLFTETSQVARRIRSWAGVVEGASYHRQDGVQFASDFILSRRLLKKALKLIGIELRRRKPTESESGNLKNGRVFRWKPGHNKPVGAGTGAGAYETTPSEDSLVSGHFSDLES
jgi:hypothetical protein